jgi:hypothetical protein
LEDTLHLVLRLRGGGGPCADFHDMNGLVEKEPTLPESHMMGSQATVKYVRKLIADNISKPPSHIKLYLANNTLIPLSDDEKTLNEAGHQYGKIMYTYPNIWDVVDIQKVSGEWGEDVLEIAGLTKGDVKGAISQDVKGMVSNKTD